MQKFAVPLAIVIAGAMIAVSLYYINSRPPAPGTQPLTVQKDIRAVQKDDHILGNPNAKIVIVEYSDPECPYCKQFQDTMHQVIAQYGASGNVAWVYRHWPVVSLHPKGPIEAEALECAGEQGGNEMFWKYADAIYATTTSNNSLDGGVYNTPAQIPKGNDGKPAYAQKTPRSATDAGQLSDIAQSLGLDVTKFEGCLQSGKYAAHIKKDSDEVVAAGGTGTPYSILVIDDQQIPFEGAQPFNVMKGLIDSLL